MSNRIVVGQGASNSAQMLARGINHIFAGIADIRRAKLIMNAAQYGTPADNTSLAAEFGITTGQNPASSAADMTVIVANFLNAIDDPDVAATIAELARLDQG